MALKIICGLGAIVWVFSLSVTEWQPVVLTGDVAPDTGGAVFASLGHPSINSNGDVVFEADLQGSPVLNGIFRSSRGTISRVVAFGDSVPNVSSLFSNFGDPAVNDKDQVAFVARIGRGYDRQGLFLYENAEILPVALTGDEAPGTAGTFVAFGQPRVVLNNEGMIAFGASFDGPLTGDGIFMYSNGKLTPVVLTGQSAPGGAMFDRFLGMDMNQFGQISFAASLTAGPGGSGVFAVDSSGTRTIAIEGQPAPYGAGVSLGRLLQPSIDDAGDVAFVDATPIRGRFGDTFIPSAVVVSEEGKMSVAASIDSSAQTSDSILFGNFQQPLMLRKDSGKSVLFVGWKQRHGVNSLLLQSDTGLSELLKEGDATDVGGIYSFIGNLALADSGYVCFVSNLEGSSVKAGIFARRLSL